MWGLHGMLGQLNSYGASMGWKNENEYKRFMSHDPTAQLKKVITLRALQKYFLEIIFLRTDFMNTFNCWNVTIII